MAPHSFPNARLTLSTTRSRKSRRLFTRRSRDTSKPKWERPISSKVRVRDRSVLRLRRSSAASHLVPRRSTNAPEPRLRKQRCPISGWGILMKLTATHEPSGDVGRLQFGAFRRRMRGEITGDSDEDMPALDGIAPLGELPHAGVQRLVGMEACVLAQ